MFINSHQNLILVSFVSLEKWEKVWYVLSGDVLGYFTPSYKLNTNTYPLNVTFRNASMDDANASLVVDMYSVPSKSCTTV